MRDDYNHSLKQRRAGITASERAAEAKQTEQGVRLGPAETHAKQETEREIAARLAALEALDPSQTRPTPKASILNPVAFVKL